MTDSTSSLPDTPAEPVRGALLVGSLPFPDTETTLRTAIQLLGDRLRRIPDGEVGVRFHWIMFQPDVLGGAEGLERIGDEPIPFGPGMDARPLRIAEGVDAADLVLPALGYAASARESYAVFSRLRGEGVIPEGIRFQVSLPTPLAVVSSFFFGDDRAVIEPVYTAAILRELREILEAIPGEDLSIQWDVASEMGILEGASGYGHTMDAWWSEDVLEGIGFRTAALIDAVPEGVEVGMHLCYGDAGEKHFIEPRDSENLALVASAVVSRANRSLTWLHLPVPIDREDREYYEGLGGLPEVQELYLGLMHREDGAAGALRRIAAARQVVPRFGIATECGIGRAPAGTAEELLASHAEVSAAW